MLGEIFRLLFLWLSALFSSSFSLFQLLSSLINYFSLSYPLLASPFPLSPFHILALFWKERERERNNHPILAHGVIPPCKLRCRSNIYIYIYINIYIFSVLTCACIALSLLLFPHSLPSLCVFLLISILLSLSLPLSIYLSIYLSSSVSLFLSISSDPLLLKNWK